MNFIARKVYLMFVKWCNRCQCLSLNIKVDLVFRMCVYLLKKHMSDFCDSWTVFTRLYSVHGIFRQYWVIVSLLPGGSFEPEMNLHLYRKLAVILLPVPPGKPQPSLLIHGIIRGSWIQNINTNFLSYSISI